MNTAKHDTANQYVSGLFFSPLCDRVILLHKLRGPEHVVGTWTGVGGHIKVGEGIRSAMAREFEEEAAVWVDPTRWYGCHVGRYRNGAVCHFLTAEATDLAEFYAVKQADSEPVGPFSVSSILSVLARDPANSVRIIRSSNHARMNPELAYLLPLALHTLLRPARLANIGY